MRRPHVRMRFCIHSRKSGGTRSFQEAERSLQWLFQNDPKKVGSPGDLLIDVNVIPPALSDQPVSLRSKQFTGSSISEMR